MVLHLIVNLDLPSAPGFQSSALLFELRELPVEMFTLIIARVALTTATVISGFGRCCLSLSTNKTSSSNVKRTNFNGLLHFLAAC